MKRTLAAIGVVVALSWRVSRRRLIIGASLVLAASLAQPGIAFLVRNLTNDALSGDDIPMVVTLAVGVSACLVGQLLLGNFAHLWYFELGELDEIELNAQISHGISDNQRLDLIESPTVADSIDLLRQDVVRIRATVEAAIMLCAVVIQLASTCALLMTVSPYLLILPAGASVPLLLTNLAERPLQRAREACAGHTRRIKNLRDISTRPDSAKEVRLGDAAARLSRLHNDSQKTLATEMDRAYRKYTTIRLLGQVPFALTLLGAIAYTAMLTLGGHASAGELVMVLALATQIGGQVGNALQQLNTVGMASSGLDRITQLGKLSNASPNVRDHRPLPTSLQRGLRLDSFTFRYPGNTLPSLQAITLSIPAGTSVAIVGENGAGKSTLIKLIQGLYRPTNGQIFIDSTPLSQLTLADWHNATTSLFQDFVHFDFRVAETIGIGDIANIADGDAIASAVARAKARTLVERIGGIDSYIGRGYADGIELSGGQWQTIGLARCLMKEWPLLLTLDEPGHSLDPESEVHMIEAYENAAREYAHRSGAITFYVTHRLSSVRSADTILVLRDGHFDASGTHDELMRQNGYYSDLFSMQAAVYADSD